MKILIAYDGSECAEAALDDLTRAGLPKQGEAVVLSVADVWLPPPPPSAYEIVEHGFKVRVPQGEIYDKTRPIVCEAHKRATAARERIQTNFPDWTVQADSSYGSPAWEIISRADQWKPDLIVVGSHGRSALGRLVLGSVAQRVLSEARCSVRVARGRVDEPGVPVRLIAGLDGSNGSERAVREIARRSWPKGTEVRLLIATDPLAPTFIGDFIPGVSRVVEESNREERAWHDKVLEDAAHILRNSDLAIHRELVEGDPKRVLVERADDWRADCLFVGSTGYSNRLERFVLGSVSAAVAARAHCSVEVIR